MTAAASSANPFEQDLTARHTMGDIGHLPDVSVNRIAQHLQKEWINVVARARAPWALLKSTAPIAAGQLRPWSVSITIGTRRYPRQRQAIVGHICARCRDRSPLIPHLAGTGRICRGFRQIDAPHRLPGESRRSAQACGPKTATDGGRDARIPARLEGEQIVSSVMVRQPDPAICGAGSASTSCKDRYRDSGHGPA
jgi:hypothetical protein